MASLKRFVNEEELEAGDIIEFQRGFYSHCGISDGNGNVIHRAADPRSGSGAAFETNGFLAIFNLESNKAEIRKDDLILVAGSSQIYRTNMFDEVITPCTGEEIVKWVKEQMGENGYNVFTKNCQHFCTEARYGKPMNMQVEKYIGLRTGFSYEKNRILVNTIKLPHSSLQPVAKTTAVENVLKGSMLRQMDLDNLSKKGMCVLASSSFALQPILTSFKNYTLFTDSSKGFDRYSTNTTINSYPFRIVVTTNCSINEEGGTVILRIADTWSGASAACDIYSFAKLKIECCLADPRSVAWSSDFNCTTIFNQGSRHNTIPQELCFYASSTDTRTDVNESMSLFISGYRFINSGNTDRVLIQPTDDNTTAISINSKMVSQTNCSIKLPKLNPNLNLTAETKNYGVLGVVAFSDTDYIRDNTFISEIAQSMKNLDSNSMYDELFYFMVLINIILILFVICFVRLRI